MISAVVKQRLFTFLSLFIIPLPAFAHGDALIFMGTQMMLYFALLLLTLFLAVSGKRLLSFVVVLFAYPAVFMLVGVAGYQLFPSATHADEAWAYVMYGVWGLSLLALIQIHIKHKAIKAA